ncbi:MAG: BTAD domain-containing putative transcriptional regulator [Actinomycetota bacterium]
MHLRGLGPVAVVDKGGAVRGLRGQQATLLATLMASYPRGVSADTLSEQLWGSDAPPTAATGLRVVVNRLRERLGDDIQIEHEGDGWRLIAEPDQLDLVRFERLHRRGEQELADGNAPAAISTFTEALGLWGGRVFQQCEPTQVLDGRSVHLEGQRLDAQERLIQALLAGGDFDRAAELSSTATNAEPFREQRWELLLRSLYGAGRHVEALRSVQDARHVFLEELGVDLSPSLVELETAILNHELEPSASATAAAPGGTELRLARAAPRIPAPASSFYGREDELALLHRLAGEQRMVTVVGPGGSGKTRLVAEYVRSLPEIDIVWVDLTGSPDGSVVELLAVQLGVRTSERPLDQVLDAIAGDPLVIVIDNCEDRPADVAALVESVMRYTAATVVATSRVALDCESEVRLELRSLDTDAARRLLRDRAFGSGEPWSPDAASLDPVIDALDGLPLALELVASELRVVGPDELAERVRRSLTPVSSTQRVDGRHQRMSDTIDESLARLSPPSASLLNVLANLDAGIGFEEATLLDPSGDREVVADRLGELTAHSLLQRQQASPPSFRVLSTVRTRVRERLTDAETAATAARSVDVFSDIVATWSPHLRTEREVMAVRRIGASVAHIEHALNSALASGDVEKAAAIVVGMHDYSVLRLRYDHFGWADSVLALDAASSIDDAAELLAVAALSAWADQRFDDGDRLTAAAFEIAQQRGAAPPFRAFSAAFNLASQRGRFDEAGRLLSTMMHRTGFREDPYEAVLSLGNLTLGLVHSGLDDEAMRAAGECLPVAQASGNVSLLAWAHHAAGAAQSAARPADALRSFQESIRLSMTVDNRWSQGMAMSAMVSCLRRLGLIDEAADTAAQLIDHWRRAQFAAHLHHAMLEAVPLLVERRHLDTARYVVAAVDGEADVHPLTPSDEAHLRELRSALGSLPIGATLQRSLIDEVLVALRSFGGGQQPVGHKS